MPLVFTCVVPVNSSVIWFLWVLLQCSYNGIPYSHFTHWCYVSTHFFATTILEMKTKLFISFLTLPDRAPTSTCSILLWNKLKLSLLVDSFFSRAWHTRKTFVLVRKKKVFPLDRSSFTLGPMLWFAEHRLDFSSDLKSQLGVAV